jgi:hypothetical protein
MNRCVGPASWDGSIAKETTMFLPPDQPVDDRAPGDVIDDLHAEIDRLRARIQAARIAYTEAVDEARKPRMKTTLERQQWDDGYKNGVEACASVVWAALTPRRV